MSAKEMFEELGYELDEKTKVITYLKVTCIPDRLNTKWVNCKYIRFNAKGISVWENVYNLTFEQKLISKDENYISIEELQAINKQVEELGWNER